MHPALETFLASDEFAEAIIKSTKAGFGGSGYSVELFPDGTSRVLWDNQIGNKYESPGVILSIPQLNDEDYQELVQVAGSDDTAILAKEFFASDLLDQFADELREALLQRN